MIKHLHPWPALLPFNQKSPQRPVISPPKSILILGMHPSIPLLCLKKHGFHQISEPKETKTPAHPSVMINLIDSDSLP